MQPPKAAQAKSGEWLKSGVERPKTFDGEKRFMGSIVFILLQKNRTMFTEEIAALTEYETEREKPMPSKHHSIIQGNLSFFIRLIYKDLFRVLPEISLVLPIRDRVPDLAIYPPMEYGEEEIKMTQIPLCLVEILSPTQNHIDLLIKRRQYFDAGVKSYWLVFPDPKSVYVYSNPDEFEVYSYRDVLKDTTLGIELPLADIFK